MSARYRSLGWILALSVLPLGATLFLHVWRRVPLSSLTRDPNVLGGLPVHAGFLSQVGLFGWAAAAAICLFSASVARAPGRRRFLRASGALTLLLGVDDAFQLHEAVLPYVGVPQLVVLAGYALLTLGYLVGFRREVLSTDPAALGVALACFSVSVALDVLPLAGVGFYEDAAKLVGIAAWLVYFSGVGAQAVAPGGSAGPPARPR